MKEKTEKELNDANSRNKSLENDKLKMEEELKRRKDEIHKNENEIAE